MTRLASINAPIMSRTGARSGSSQLVAQVVHIQAHHTALNRITVSSAPNQVNPSSK